MQKLQISIPEPCHENWQTMTQTDQGRYCNACAKEVIDFSMMTDTEVLNYFTTLSRTKVCGRVLPSQLSRNITRPREPKKRLFWYWNYIVMFFMFFGKANSTKAQGNIKAVKQTEVGISGSTYLTGDTVISKALCTERSKQNPEIGRETKIRIGDIAVLSENTRAIYVVDGTMIDYTPEISPDDVDDITILPSKTATAIYGSMGSDGAIVITTRKAKEKNLDTVVVGSGLVLGRMTMHSSDTTVIKAYEPIFNDSTKASADNTDPHSSIYPNPVSRGNSITVAMNFKQTGLHQVQITDANGRTVLYRRINALSKTQNEVIVCDSKWASGFYYINIYNNKNQLVNKSSFIVQ